MAANERLRVALARNGLTYREFGEAVDVDPKTVERWVTTGRTPHRAKAHRAAVVLREDVAHLWPALEQGRRRRGGAHPELVAVHPTRTEASFELWRAMFTRAEQEIGILVYAAVFMHEQWPDLNDVLRAKADAGCRVRVLLGDPDSPVIGGRGAEEKYGHGIEARCRVALLHYRPLLDVPGVEVHQHDTILYNSIYRGDDQMLVNTHVFGMNAYGAPIWHLKRSADGGLFDVYAQSFEDVWARSRPAKVGD